MCQDVSPLLYLAFRSIRVPCPKRGIVILDKTVCRHAEMHRRTAYLRLAHGNVFIYDVTDRARFLAHCKFSVTRLFPLRVYLRIDALLLRKEFVRVLFCLRRSVSVDISRFRTNPHAFFLSPICFCSAFDCLLKPLASKSTVRGGNRRAETPRGTGMTYASPSLGTSE